MTTGKQLRTERRALELKMTDVARLMGVSRTTLWTIEKAAEVHPAQEAAFRDAVARLTAGEQTA